MSRDGSIPHNYGPYLTYSDRFVSKKEAASAKQNLQNQEDYCIRNRTNENIKTGLRRKGLCVHCPIWQTPRPNI